MGVIQLTAVQTTHYPPLWTKRWMPVLRLLLPRETVGGQAPSVPRGLPGKRSRLPLHASLLNLEITNTVWMVRWPLSVLVVQWCGMVWISKNLISPRRGFLSAPQKAAFLGLAPVLV